MKSAQMSCKIKSAWTSMAFLLLLSIVAIPLTGAAQRDEKKKSADLQPASIDVNRASAEDFAKLPGIGPELARRIIVYRQKHGQFRRVEDVFVIRGIGPKKWKALRPYLRVQQNETDAGKGAGEEREGRPQRPGTRKQ